MIYRKLYIDKISPFIDTPFIKVITGVRRCGKSTIMAMLQKKLLDIGVASENILSYRFDSLQFESIRTAQDLFDAIKGRLSKNGKTYLFLDEVQEIEDWEKAVNSLASDFNVDIYVTGSNSRMMSSEISTYLTGRYVSFRIYPLSFSEYLSFRESYTSTSDRYSEFHRYLRMGGFPALHLRDYSEDEAYTVVKDIYNATVFTDIVKRNQIRKVDLLERIVKFIFSNVGQTFSALSLAKYLKSENRKIDIETVYNYINKLESAYLIHRCSRYDIKGKEHLKTLEKFYLADPSLCYSILGFNKNFVAGMLENLVYMELKRHGFDVSVGKLGIAEIDFIATKKNEKFYIQITQKIESKETELREYGRLLSIADNHPKFVLTTDEFSGGNYEGIKTIHIADFLANPPFS